MSEIPEVILEPGDPGYVAPENQQQNAPPNETTPEQGPQTQTEQVDTDVVAPGPNETVGPAPVGEDLTHVREARETDAEYLARTRNTVVVSQSPTDIVPNTPQTTMGNRVPVEGQEGLEIGVPPETPPVEGEAVPVEGEQPLATETPVLTTPAEETPA